jgi:hypothetical protein
MSIYFVLVSSMAHLATVPEAAVLTGLLLSTLRKRRHARPTAVLLPIDLGV